MCACAWLGERGRMERDGSPSWRLGRRFVMAAAFLVLANPGMAPAIEGERGGAGKIEKSRPEFTPNDPVKLVVSLPRQTIKVYRGKKLILSSRVSTGQPGYETPAGVFTILQKRRWHKSNIYSDAPMPFMQRLTWSGIALHAGRVPGYPASHGCIRLPRRFAIQLFSLTRRGAQVVVTRNDTEPVEIFHEALPQPIPLPALELPWPQGERISEASADAAGEIELPMALTPALQLAETEAEFELLRRYAKRSAAPLHILITRRNGRERLKDAQRLLARLGHEPGGVDGYMGPLTASAIRDFQQAAGLRPDGRASDELIAALYRAAGEGEPPTGHLYVRQNFRPLLDAPIRILRPRAPLGTHVYTAMDFPRDARHARWLAISLTSFLRDRTGIESQLALQRIEIPEAIRRELAHRLTPGSSLIVSDSGLGPEDVRGTNFVVLVPKVQ